MIDWLLLLIISYFKVDDDYYEQRKDDFNETKCNSRCHSTINETSPRSILSSPDSILCGNDSIITWLEQFDGDLDIEEYDSGFDSSFVSFDETPTLVFEFDVRQIIECCYMDRIASTILLLKEISDFDILRVRICMFNKMLFKKRWCLENVKSSECTRRDTIFSYFQEYKSNLVYKFYSHYSFNF